MTTVEFSDDIMRQIELTNKVENDTVESKELDFDAKGTVHIMYRDADGKLLHDTPIKEVDTTDSYYDSVVSDYRQYKESIARQTKQSRLAFIFLIITLMSLSAGAIIFLLTKYFN